MYIIGIVGFALFFLGDLNDLRSIHKLFKASFYAGCLFLVISTALLLINSRTALPWAVRVPFMLLAALFLFLTMISLFGSFSVEDGYEHPGEKRPVYTKKLYALSRHPGIPFLILFYACLIPAFGFPVKAVLLFALLDIALGIFEDMIVFPRMLSGYAAYKETTPCMIPNGKSIRACIEDFKGRTE